MNLNLNMLSPPKRLAIAYAKMPHRQALAILLSFDVTFGGVACRQSEPILAQLRMAWWRDVIHKRPGERPSGEPLTADLSRLQTAYPGWNMEKRVSELLDGWCELLVGDSWDDAMIDRHINARAAAIFCGYGVISGQGDGDALLQIGRNWALSDLRSYCRDAGQIDTTARLRCTVALHPVPEIPRALSILEMSNRENISPVRLFWHALTRR